MLATDFGALPPEVNSALLYEGPGSGPMLTAATAWESLTAVLNSAAVSYASVVSALTLESWLGPASASMAAAAAPYAEWLSAAAEQARQTAAQASAAAAAYETARAAAVPPPVIAANRSQLALLVTTNTFGQNTPAIETIQADYAEMWAQDAAVMYQYAEASETASTLMPFSQPAHTADPTASASQAAQVPGGADASAVAGPAASIGPETLQLLAAAASSPLTSQLPAPAASITIPTPIGELDVLALYIAAIGTTSLSLSVVNTARPWYYGYNGFRPAPSPGAIEPTQGEPISSEREVLASSQRSVAGAPVSAGTGQAALVGGLSVPHGWTMAAPEIKLAVESLPSAGLTAAPTDLGGAPVGLLSGMALAGLAGRGAGGTGPRVPNEAAAEEDGEPRRKPTVVVIQQPPPAGGTPGNRPH
ncbi:PPE family protein [Mycobacterium pseudokansasii]|uniref:PPE family protein n=1 Tax=Mycobacterium pseudokansasii TaxID=2341080 RepID=UPI000452E07E|nr:PPE family protein [Mycobacterium pseudokansasii]EUA11486.1 PPE family protein [Mycobacterium kansasii 732]VBA30386.1 putative PPE family protein PPE32 [Mycobacterium pseudokansasii]VBA32136.1 putative PPE family protein PPE32 [Mycobacterium pseudokansasii]